MLCAICNFNGICYWDLLFGFLPLFVWLQCVPSLPHVGELDKLASYVLESTMLASRDQIILHTSTLLGVVCYP